MVLEIAASRLHTLQFEEWEHQLASTIGHHSSSLLTPEIPFAASMEVIRSAEVAIVALEGSSSLRLHRHQPPDQVVLWLPQMGWVEEMVNGRGLVAEPGTAMLCLPGDELLGDTTAHLKGVSLLIPASLLGEPGRWQGFPRRHLAHTSDSLTAMHMVLEIVSVLRNPSAGLELLVAALADQLIFWRDRADQTSTKSRPVSVERRRLISQAREWIDAHLDHPFQVADLAAALHVSSRNLQYCFCEELGHSPLVEVRRVRFRKLRQELLSIAKESEPIEVIFRRCGLIDTTVTRRHYRQWCGETPKQTWARASDASPPSPSSQMKR
ncbi:MAG: helix-turn-helix domain-containing protein [Cyanobacteriota bacterium]|jgi:AraC-like DNA-binding protein